MKKQEKLAQKLDGREVGSEITEQECREAKKDGLIVVFGESDDLCEFRGVFEEEFSSYKGNTYYWIEGKFRILLGESDLEECPQCNEVCPNCSQSGDGKFYVKQEWCPKGYDGSWLFTTNIPNAAEFKIYEDGSLYGNGLVINIDDLSYPKSQSKQSLENKVSSLREELAKIKEQDAEFLEWLDIGQGGLYPYATMRRSFDIPPTAGDDEDHLLEELTIAEKFKEIRGIK